LDWFSKAGGLPGKTLHVALILWYLSGLNKSREVRLGSKQLAAFGVSRDAKYQALQRLRESGLVEVDQQPGRVPVVTILIIPDETSGKSGTKEEPIGKNMR
jgi:DNA-binding transcriptional ArsR family regulator